MDTKQFCTLQVFELLYLVSLAYLPFVIALREVSIIILSLSAVVTAVVGVRRLLSKKVDPAGKVVFISGCDSGFGNACARRLGLYGFTVVAGCLDPESEGAVTLRDGTNGRIHVVPLDLTRPETMSACVELVQELSNNKGLWALINNAGVACFGDIEFTPVSKYRELLEVNVVGTISLTKLCLPLIRKGTGRVINMSGTTGLLAAPGQSAFCISNFAIEAFSEALRIEMEPFGTKVIVVRPGNYLGTTGILNRASCEKLKGYFDEIQDSTGKDILISYGEKYLEKQYLQLTSLAKSSANSMVNVVSAMEAAVTNVRSKSHYLVDGGNQLLDSFNILVRLKSYIPYSLRDRLVSVLYREGVQLDSLLTSRLTRIDYNMSRLN